ncbi:alpha-hydroxy acid oxidase [Azospirillum rugosum]|uniref:4-hydroxymandelate oxidase n=1 Tax=Azospirillum rugosum TaxID=416170 RepID=A0ABS4SUT5_9PROT|nr:alpha-hydroxy acid oxidase [Azospirillum rugosum]MBP2296331.1 4-hydroxymandelate oxidase [Azospirillum rugosum]MDQ0529852.1 4-hydroxymandelate oxidase [Azospirillum rugosum]
MIVPPDTVSLSDYERHFTDRVDPATRAYIAGTGADGITQRANREAFDRLRLMPRALRDLSNASARATLLGEAMAYPIIVAPMAYHRLLHPDGERATAAAAALTGTWMTVSTQASVTLEEVAATAPGNPLWFQLYLRPRPEDTLALIRRAEDAGYRALVLTVDAPVNGLRNMEQRAGFRLPEGIAPVNLAGMAPDEVVGRRPGSPVFQGMLQNAPTWDSVAWLCAQTRLPVLLKGILNPEDVEPAVAAGAGGLIVSNHGGRTLDTLPATIEALPLVAAAAAGRLPILMDGGIRRGTDILKAIALGADVVMVGQPVLHALAVGGVAGVAHALTILQTELEVAMALTGRARLADIDRSVIFDPPRS